MYELDHMLNGKQSSLHHQELIQLAEQERMLRDAEQYAQHSEKKRTPQPLHAILALLMKVIGSI